MVMTLKTLILPLTHEVLVTHRTKVLNMKPKEILGMVEEACGTRLYEMKKAQAQKTMEKKDVKVSEITKILEEG